MEMGKELFICIHHQAVVEGSIAYAFDMRDNLLSPLYEYMYSVLHLRFSLYVYGVIHFLQQDLPEAVMEVNFCDPY